MCKDTETKRRGKKGDADQQSTEGLNRDLALELIIFSTTSRPKSTGIK
jgi:hypothetical protein